VSRRLGRGVGREKPAVRLDQNVLSYDAQRDGRSVEGRVQHIRIDRIDPSPYQVRRVFPEREIEELAESIRANGLIHEPRGRPDPDHAGRVQLMPGEMRLRALQRLIERGEAEGVLQQDGEGNWLVPIHVEAVDDDRAEAMVLSENLDRTDLSAWEWALAWRQRRDSLRGRGQPASVRDVASSLGKKFQTIGQYLRAADGLDEEVLHTAGVVTPEGPDHRRMGQLSLAALLRVASAREQGREHGAERLLRELKGAGDSLAATQLERFHQRERRLRGAASFQINIRQALTDLSAAQAQHYLDRLAPAVEILCERAAAEIAPDRAAALARSFDAAAARLRPSHIRPGE
jgi:ParB-like chromosome segregation protein Spo0J